MELLPTELQLGVLEQVSNYKDLISLVVSSRVYYATYLGYKKRVLACVTEAALGTFFVDGCMLLYWESYINRSAEGYMDRSAEDADDRLKSSLLAHWLRDLHTRPTKQRKIDWPDGTRRLELDPWPLGPYRHVQLRFIYDWDRYAKAGVGDQVRGMQGLLEAGDFLRILAVHGRVMELVDSPRWREGHPRWPTSELASQLVDRCGFCRFVVEGIPVLRTQTQRMVKTFYRFLACVALYGEDGRYGMQREAMEMDFLGRFDKLESKKLHELMSSFRISRSFWHLMGYCWVY